MKPIAYSYIRFSTPEQSKGGSLARQTEAANEYAAKHGLALDDKLNMSDLGVSAFSGKNFSDGALGLFIKAIQDGRVTSGSFLLVEDIDRLSRLPVMEALSIFQTIIGGGVIIVTLKNGTQYSLELLKGDWTPLMPLLFSMARGHEESERKSFLLGSAWRAKKAAARATLTPLGNTAPMWLTFSPETGYVLHPERLITVRRIFELSIAGHGLTTIAKTLNAEKRPTFRNGTTWGNSSLQKVVRNRAVIGEYQPHEGSGRFRRPLGESIPGYFPPAISEETFYAVQQAIARRTIGRSTRQPQNFNVWQAIAKCKLCGASLHLISKGKPPKGYKYLICSNAKKGMCGNKLLRVDESELMFREILAKVDSLELVQDSSASTSRDISTVETQLARQYERKEKLMAALEADVSTGLTELLIRCETKIKELQTHKETLSLALASQNIINKEEFFASLDLVTYENRYRANALLIRLEIKVHIDAKKPVRYYVERNNQALIEIYNDGHQPIIIPSTADQFERLKQQNDGTSILRYVTRKKAVPKSIG